MPVYRYVPDGADAGELYGTTFESRQLASVELLNSTHQRIDLFLSIFTLRPGENLTVLIPFREVPVEVDVKESTDREFLNDIGYDDIVQAHKEQHYSTSGKRFGRRTGTAVTNAAMSTAFTPLGLGARYYMEKFKLSEGKGRGMKSDNSEGSLGGGDDYEAEVKEIAHYDFEGVSISVYSVSADATLDDFLDVVDLGTLPDITREVVEEYREQYVAVIESVPSPPIDPADYTWLLEYAPNTTADIIEKMRTDVKVEYDDVWNMAPDFAYDAFREFIDGGGNATEWFVDEWDVDSEDVDERVQHWYEHKYEWTEYYYYDYYFDREDRTPFDLRNIMEDLFYAVYGFTDFKGNVLSVTTSLNDGMMYFPLGTSKGWENPIQDTRVICVADDDVSLEVTPGPKYNAFVDGKHYYILEFMDDNPDKDTTAKISETSGTARFAASTWSVLYDNTPWLAVVLGIAFQLLLWFVLLNISGRFDKGKDKETRKKVFSARHCWMGVLNIVISAPLTFMFMGWKSGKEKGKNERRFYMRAYVPLIVIDVLLFMVEVAG